MKNKLTQKELKYVRILLGLNNYPKEIPYKKRFRTVRDIPDCNECVNCLDKPKNGGKGKRKQICKIKLQHVQLLKNL